MATFDFTLTDADAARNLGVPDGYLVSLTRTTPPVHEAAIDVNCAAQHHKSRYLVLRGSRDPQNLINVETSNNCIAGGVLVGNHSLNYAGNLIALAVPRGSEWRLTLSDVPNVRALRGP